MLVLHENCMSCSQANIIVMHNLSELTKTSNTQVLTLALVTLKMVLRSLFISLGCYMVLCLLVNANIFDMCGGVKMKRFNSLGERQ